jgi:hypothetical protein
MSTIITTDQIKALASKDLAREWTHPGTGETRWYLQIEALIGLDLERYKSGNIWSAELGGEKISNSEATRITAARAWISGTDGTLYMQSPARPRTDLASLIKAGIAEATAEATA